MSIFDSLTFINYDILVRNFWNEFKTPIVTVALIFLAFAVYTLVLGPIPFSINSINTNKTDLFSVSGEGTITSVPDSAAVEAGITGQATTVSDAQNKTNQIAGKIIEDVKKLGVADKDIKTTNYSVTPSYGQSVPEPMMAPIRGGGNIVGYTVTQNLEIKVKPIENANKIVDTATADGANLVGGVNFSFSDETQAQLEQKATTMAVANAKKKANDLANAAGIKLGRIVNVATNNQGLAIMPMIAAGVAQKADTTQPTNVIPGQNTVTVDVTLSYETY